MSFSQEGNLWIFIGFLFLNKITILCGQFKENINRSFAPGCSTTICTFVAHLAVDMTLANMNTYYFLWLINEAINNKWGMLSWCHWLNDQRTGAQIWCNAGVSEHNGQVVGVSKPGCVTNSTVSANYLSDIRPKANIFLTTGLPDP